MSDPSPKADPEVRSVDRAMRLLEVLAESRAELGVTELGRRLGIHKATASRLLTTMAAHGIVERNPLSKRYRLGVGLMPLAAASSTRMDLVRQARPILEDLSSRTKEAAGLAVLDGGTVIYVDEIAGPWSVGVTWVGRRAPLHCTSSGQVFLAWEERLRNRTMRHPLEAFTPSTIVDHAMLDAELARVRQRGYARSIEELEEGLVAVAAPIRRSDGGVVAALSVSGPAFRFRPRDVPRFGAKVAEAAASASRRLGHTERRR